MADDILRKRAAFRAAFAGFDPEQVARFGDADRARLMADTGIVRATGSRSRRRSRTPGPVLGLRDTGGLDALLVVRPAGARATSRHGERAATSPESVALAKALKRAGFVFVGPTTMYAAMQACGVVDDHVLGCTRAGAR